MDTILALQSSRSAADCERAGVEVDESLPTFFGPPYGPLTQSEVARLNEAFEGYAKSVDVIVKAEKKSWSRLRPYLEDQRVHPCVELESKYSYPSGHATLSEVFAELLTRIFPKRDAAIFISRAHQIGNDRVMAGMHHPTDIAAGQQLGHEIVEKWLRDPAFVAGLEHLRAASP